MPLAVLLNLLTLAGTAANSLVVGLWNLISQNSCWFDISLRGFPEASSSSDCWLLCPPHPNLQLHVKYYYCCRMTATKVPFTQLYTALPSV